MKMVKGSRQLAVISLAVLVVLLLSLSWALADTSPPLEVWSRTFGGSDDEYGRSVRETSDGGYIIAGTTHSFGAGWSDVYLVKADSQGSEEWSRTFGGSEEDSANSVQETSDGGYIIAGWTSSFGAGYRDVYLVKADSEGVEEWSRTFGGSEEDFGYSVQETSDGGYIIAGTTDSFDTGGGDIYLVKTDSQGGEEWSTTFGGSTSDWVGSVQETSDGGYIITGTMWSFGAGWADVYLVKADSQGLEEWSTTFGGSDDDYGRSVQQTSDGGYIIAGTTDSFDTGVSHVYLVKTDSQGGEEWSTTFGGSEGARGNSVQETSDGGYIITGYTYSFGASGADVYLVKADSQGLEEWSRTLGGPLYDFGQSVQETSDGGYIIAGWTSSFGAGEYDVYLVKVDSQGRAEYTYTASIVNLEAPAVVNSGASFTVDLTVSYEFTFPTEMTSGIFDGETYSGIVVEYETLVGEGTKTYSFELTAPEEETTWALGANVWYNLEGDWVHDEEEYSYAFEISVVGASDDYVEWAIELQEDTPYDAEINPEGDWDYYTFNATPGEYFIETFSDIDTYLHLYDTDGETEITRDDDSGEDWNALIFWECTSPGMYYLKVRGYAEYVTGEYSVAWVNATASPTVTITGYITYYNNEPFPHENTTMSGYSPAWDSLDVYYDSQTGMFTANTSLHGESYFNVFVDAAEPYGTGGGYSGDYQGGGQVYVPINATVVSGNLSVYQTIHLVSPVDNSDEIGPDIHERFEYTQDELVFEWEPLPEASSYNVYISRYNQSGYWMDSDYYYPLTNTSITLNLSPNNVGEYYSFQMDAYNEQGQYVGELMIAYADGYTYAYEFEVVEARAREIALYDGWNLISLPLTPENSSIQVVLADILDKVTVVWAFNGETEIWSSYLPDVPMVINDLTEMVDNRGYWIMMTEDATLTVQGEYANTSELALFEGWSLISIPLTPEDPSIEIVLADILDKVTVVQAFDGETETWSSYLPDVPMILNDLTEMVDDRGYWIMMTEDATLTVHG